MAEGTVYTGPFSSEFENHFLERLLDSIRENPLSPKICLVSSNYLAMYLRHKLLEELPAHAGIEFLTFKDLSERLCFHELAKQGRHPLPGDIEELMIERRTAELPPKSRFHEIRLLPGFHRSLRSTFHDLIDGGCLSIPKEFNELRELQKLFSTHREEYSNRFYTNADLVLEGSRCAARFSETFGSKHLFVYGFYDLTFTQSLLLEELQKDISITYWIPEVAEKSTLQISKSLVQAVSGWGNEEKSIGSAEKPQISFVSSATNYLEPQDLTLRLLDHPELFDPKGRTAILLRDFEQSSDHFHQVLSRANLPHYVEGGFRDHTSFHLKSLLSLLELLESDWSRTKILALLKAYPWPEDIVRDCGQPEDWDLWSRRTNVTRGFHSLEQGMKRLANRKKGDVLIEGFNRKVLPWIQSVQDLKNVSSWNDLVHGVEKIFFRFLPEESVDPDLRTLLRKLRSLDEVFPAKDSTTMFKVLEGRITKLRKKANPFQQDSIFIGRLESTRCVRFDHIVIPSLVEGLFPGSIRNDPLLPDHERKKLNEKYGCKISIRDTRPDEEAFLFQLVQSSCKNLTLSYPRRDAAGSKEYFPSIFYKNAVEDASIEKFALLAWTQTFRKNIDLYDLHHRLMGKLLLEENLRSDSLASVLPFLPFTEALADGRFGMPLLTTYDGILADIGKFEETRLASATEIQQYVECPFRYFLKYRCRLEPFDAPDDIETLSPLDRGSIIHDILQIFFKQATERELVPLRQENQETLREIFEEVLKEVFTKARATYAIGYEGLWDAEQSFIRNDLWQLLEKDMQAVSPFVPKGFEVGFGFRKKEGPYDIEEPLEIDLGRAKLLFRGRIDRLDISAEGQRARVVDYKTGKSSDAKDNSFRGGKTIQLPLYLLASQKILKDIDLHAIHGELVFTSMLSNLKTKHFQGSVLEAKRRDLQKILQTFADGLNFGLFPAIPGDHRKNCKFCDFNQLCGSSVHRTYIRKSEDPKFEKIQQLEEID